MNPIPWVESPLFYSELAASTATDEQKQWAKQYHEEGYLIFQDNLLSDLDEKPLMEFIKSPGKENRQLDFWKECPEIRSLALHKKVLDILRFLYGREPVPFQTLNFYKGTEQEVHSDTIHFNSIPPKWMCGVWIALEDVGEDQGPLVYYPKSHKLPELTYYDLGIDEMNSYAKYEESIQQLKTGYPSENFLAKKGDFLIWASNLLHGGSKIKNPDTTRLSQVTHYFFEDTIPYTPLHSNPLNGEYYIRDRIVDIRTRKPMVLTYNGKRVFFPPLPNTPLKKIAIDTKQKGDLYLSRYPDVKSAGVDPFNHFKEYGHREGRIW